MANNVIDTGAHIKMTVTGEFDDSAVKQLRDRFLNTVLSASGMEATVRPHLLLDPTVTEKFESLEAAGAHLNHLIHQAMSANLPPEKIKSLQDLHGLVSKFQTLPEVKGNALSKLNKDLENFANTVPNPKTISGKWTQAFKELEKTTGPVVVNRAIQVHDVIVPSKQSKKLQEELAKPQTVTQETVVKRIVKEDAGNQTRVQHKAPKKIIETQLIERHLKYTEGESVLNKQRQATKNLVTIQEEHGLGTHPSPRQDQRRSLQNHIKLPKIWDYDNYERNQRYNEFNTRLQLFRKNPEYLNKLNDLQGDDYNFLDHEKVGKKDVTTSKSLISYYNQLLASSAPLEVKGSDLHFVSALLEQDARQFSKKAHRYTVHDHGGDDEEYVKSSKQKVNKAVAEWMTANREVLSNLEKINPGAILSSANPYPLGLNAEKIRAKNYSAQFLKERRESKSPAVREPLQTEQVKPKNPEKQKEPVQVEKTESAKPKKAEKLKEQSFTLDDLGSGKTPLETKKVEDKSLHQVITPDNKITANTRFEIVSLDQLVKSHDLAGHANKLYPADWQERNRGDEHYQAEHIKIRNNFQPEFLLSAKTSSQGAPIITKDNVVLSGNGRSNVLEDIYKTHPANTAAYQDALKSFLPTVGLDPEQLKNVSRPVLVQRLVDEDKLDLKAFSRSSNKESVTELAGIERIRADAEAIKPALHLYQGKAVYDSKNDEFRKAINDHFKLGSELDATKVARTEAALLRATYEEHIDPLLKEFSSHPLDQLPQKIKNSISGLAQAIPQMRDMRELAQKTGQEDPTVKILEAAHVLATHNQATLKDKLQQAPLPGEKDLAPLKPYLELFYRPDAKGNAALNTLAEENTVAKRLQELSNNYSNQMQGGLFGGTTPLSKILEEVKTDPKLKREEEVKAQLVKKQTEQARLDAERDARAALEAQKAQMETNLKHSSYTSDLSTLTPSQLADLKRSVSKDSKDLEKTLKSPFLNTHAPELVEELKKFEHIIHERLGAFDKAKEDIKEANKAASGGSGGKKPPTVGTAAPAGDGEEPKKRKGKTDAEKADEEREKASRLYQEKMQKYVQILDKVPSDFASLPLKEKQGALKELSRAFNVAKEDEKLRYMEALQILHPTAVSTDPRTGVHKDEKYIPSEEVPGKTIMHPLAQLQETVSNHLKSLETLIQNERQALGSVSEHRQKQLEAAKNSRLERGATLDAQGLPISQTRPQDVKAREAFLKERLDYLSKVELGQHTTESGRVAVEQIILGIEKDLTELAALKKVTQNAVANAEADAQRKLAGVSLRSGARISTDPTLLGLASGNTQHLTQEQAAATLKFLQGERGRVASVTTNDKLDPVTSAPIVANAHAMLSSLDSLIHEVQQLFLQGKDKVAEQRYRDGLIQRGRGLGDEGWKSTKPEEVPARRAYAESQIEHFKAQPVSDHTISQIHKYTEALKELEKAATPARSRLMMIAHAFDTLTMYGGVGAVIYGITGAIKDLVSASIELEDNLKNIQAVTSATNLEMTTVAEAIKQTSSTTAFSVDEISKAVMTVAQAGTSIKDIPKTVQAVADVATATGSNLAAVADIITTVQQIWDKIDVTTIGDRIAQASNVSKLAVEDLKTIMSLEGSAATAANVSLEQNLAMVATLRNSGIKPSTIATGSTQMMRELFSPDEKFRTFLAKQYEKMGEKVSAEQAGRTFTNFKMSDNPIVAAIDELKRIGVGTFQGMTDLERSIDSRALNVLKPLLNRSEELAGMSAKIVSGQTAAEGAEVASESLKKSLGNLKDQVELTADAFIEDLLPGMRDLVEGMKDNLKEMEKNKIEQKTKDEITGEDKKSTARKVGESVTKTTIGAVDKSFDLLADGITLISDGIKGIPDAALGVIDALKPEAEINVLDQRYQISSDNLQKSIARDKEEANAEFRPYLDYVPAKANQKLDEDKPRGKYTSAINDYEESLRYLAESTKGNLIDEAQQKEVIKLLQQLRTDYSRGESTKGQREATIQKITSITGGSRTLTEAEIEKLDSKMVNPTRLIEEQFKSLMVKSDALNNKKELSEPEKQIKEAVQKMVENGDSAIQGYLNGAKPSFKEMQSSLSKFYEEMGKHAVEAQVKFEVTLTNALDSLVKSLLNKQGTEGEGKAQEALRAEINSQIGADPSRADAAKNAAKSSALSAASEQAFREVKFNPELYEADSSYRSAIDERRRKKAEELSKPTVDFANEQINVVQSEAIKAQRRNSAENARKLTEEIDVLTKKSERTPYEDSQLKAAKEILEQYNQDGSDVGYGTADILPSLRRKDSKGNIVVDHRLDKYKGLIATAAEKYGIDPIQFMAQLMEESGGNPNAVSSSGAGGLGQFTGQTADGLGLRFDRTYHKGLMIKGKFVPYDQLPDNRKKDAVNVPIPVPGGVDERMIPEKAIDASARYMAQNKKLPHIGNDPERQIISYAGPKKEVVNANLANKDGVFYKYTQSILENTKLTKNAVREGIDSTKASDKWTKEAQDRLNDRVKKGIENPDGTPGKVLADIEKAATAAYQSEPEKVREQYVISDELLDARISLEKKLETVRKYGGEDKIEYLRQLGQINKEDFENQANKVKTDPYKPEEEAKQLREKELTNIKRASAEAQAKIDAEIEAAAFETVKNQIAVLLSASAEKLKDLREKVKAAEVGGTDDELKTANDELAAALLDNHVKKLQELRVTSASDTQEVYESKVKSLQENYRREMDGINLAKIDTALSRQKREEGIYETNPVGETSAGRGYRKELVRKETLSMQKEKLVSDYNFYSKQAKNLENEKSTLDQVTPERRKEAEQKILERSQKLQETLGALRARAEDLGATLTSELDQLSTDNIVAEINNLNGSLKNLDKNISQRVVQFADTVSGDMADAAVTAGKSLLGFNTATKEATDALLNLADKQGELALVQTNRVDLAQKIQSIRLNEADPVRQEELIKQATDAQTRAEELAAFQVNEAQKAADKVEYENSFAGKFQKAAGDMVEGVAKDVIKAEILNVFTDAVGSSPSKPIYAEVTNFPSGFGIEATGGSSSADKPKTFLGGVFDKVSSFFSDSPEQRPTDYTSISEKGIFDGASLNPTSMAQGTDVLPEKIGEASSEGIYEGISKTWDTADNTFNQFTDKMGGKFDFFLTGLGTMLSMSSVAGQKKMGVLDWVKFGLGAASSITGMFSNAAGIFGSAASTLGGAGAGSFSGLESSSAGSFFSNAYMDKAGAFSGISLLNKATGGYITGPGTSTSDSIPAMLSNGEYVINAKAVKAIGKETLDAWNFENKAPIKRATGGVVGTFDNAKSAQPQTSVTPTITPKVDTNIRLVVVDDQRKVGDFINSAEGEQVMVQFMRKNSTTLKQVLR